MMGSVLIRIMQPAAPEIIAAVFGDDVDSALAVLGLGGGVQSASALACGMALGGVVDRPEGRYTGLTHIT